MEAASEAGNKYLLVVVDRSSTFLFIYPLPNDTAENMVKKLLELLLTFGIHSLYAVTQKLSSNSVQCDDRLWPLRPPEGSGAVERLGRWIHEILVELCKNWIR